MFVRISRFAVRERKYHSVAQVVSVQWIKRGIFVLLAAALVFAGSLSLQDAKAQQVPPEEFPIEAIFMSLQIDFICSSNYTGVDRIGASIPIERLFREIEAGTFDGPSEFQTPCRSYETGRISLSLNPQVLLRSLADRYSPEAVGIQPGR